MAGVAAYSRPENKVALGFVEDLNNKIRVLQRRAYGLSDEEYLLPQDPYLHAAGALTVSPYPNVPGFTHTTSRRALYYYGLVRY